MSARFINVLVCQNPSEFIYNEGGHTMKSLPIQVFLSCSFDAKDSGIVDFFRGICHGLDIECVNVSKGSPSTPPEKALQLIIDSQALVAIATCREETKAGGFMIPDAVDEEISMAYANKKPILPFVEKGVDTKTGFFRNLSTYQTFERDLIYSPAFLEKAISALHSLKMDVISPHELGLEQSGQEHVFSEFTRFLVELIDTDGSYKWRYSETRRLKFSSKFMDPIRGAAWAEVSSKGEVPSECSIKWSYKIGKTSKPFKLIPTIEKETYNSIDISFKIEPKPEKDDTLEYYTVFESPYFNPVFQEDILERPPKIIIKDNKYLCFDGIVPVVRTKDLKIQFRFPSSMNMEPRDFVPFVGSYTGKVDYIVESEMKRMTTRTDSFAGSVIIELSVESPLLQHAYGLAWNPPHKS